MESRGALPGDGDRESGSNGLDGSKTSMVGGMEVISSTSSLEKAASSASNFAAAASTSVASEALSTSASVNQVDAPPAAKGTKTFDRSLYIVYCSMLFFS
jgi:hypothetical protein